MAKRRRFSEEFKREAVGLANQPGVTKAQVGRELGVPPQPIAARGCLSDSLFQDRLCTPRSNCVLGHDRSLVCILDHCDPLPSPPHGHAFRRFSEQRFHRLLESTTT